MKSVEEKQIDCREGSKRATGNQKKTGVESRFVVLNFTGEPNSGDGNDRGQFKHEQTQAVDAEREMNPPVGGYDR